MISRNILGVILLVVGVILLVIGMNASHSFSDQMSNLFTGRFTDNTTWYIVGGIITGILGLSLMLFRTRGKNA